MFNQKVERLSKVLRPIVIILAIGFLYAGISGLIGAGMPCVFHLITGLYCPGCGISRMCMNLLAFDFNAAMSSNVFVFWMIPLFACAFMYHASEYVACGKYVITKTENAIIWCLVVFAIVFAVCRNIFNVDILVP